MAAHARDAAGTCTACGIRASHWWLASCPGVPWYPWERIPAELATRTALAREGLRPADLAAPAGYYVAWTRRAVVLLYDRRAAVPKRRPRSDRERAAQDAGARRLLAARTCTACGRVVQSARRLHTPLDGSGADPASSTERPRLCDMCCEAWQYRAALRALYRGARELLEGRGVAEGRPVRILDTETTGLDMDAEPIELAILDGASGAVLLDTRLRPAAPISPDAFAVHGIAAEALRDAPVLPDVWPRVRELLRGALVIAYNADYDRRILAQGAERYGLRRPACRWYCLMEACTVFDAPEHGRWLSLGAVCAELDVSAAEYGAAHGARADALAALAVVRALAARHDAGAEAGA